MEPDFSPPPEPHDPYAAPEARLADEPPERVPRSQPARKVRRRYGEHEATVRTLGLAYAVVGMALFLYSGVIFVTALRFAEDRVAHAPTLIVLGLFVVFALALFLTGVGLALLKPGARLASIPVSVLLILICPCGSWISIYALILIFSASTVTVFSPEYAEVIAATPRENPKPASGTLLVLWTPVAFLVVGSLLGVLRFSSLG